MEYKNYYKSLREDPEKWAKRKEYERNRYNNKTEEEKKNRIAQTLPNAKLRYQNMSEEEKQKYKDRQCETRRIRNAKKKAEKEKLEKENIQKNKKK